MNKKTFEELMSWQKNPNEWGEVMGILRAQFQGLETDKIAFFMEDLRELTMLSEPEIRTALNILGRKKYLEYRTYKQPSEEEEKFYIKLKNKKGS